MMRTLETSEEAKVLTRNSVSQLQGTTSEQVLGLLQAERIDQPSL